MLLIEKAILLVAETTFAFSDGYILLFTFCCFYIEEICALACTYCLRKQFLTIVHLFIFHNCQNFVFYECILI